MEKWKAKTFLLIPELLKPSTVLAVCRHYYFLPTLPVLVTEEAIGALVSMDSPVQSLTELDKLIHALELSAALFFSTLTFNGLLSMPVAALLICFRQRRRKKAGCRHSTHIR